MAGPRIYQTTFQFGSKINPSMNQGFKSAQTNLNKTNSAMISMQKQSAAVSKAFSKMTSIVKTGAIATGAAVVATGAKVFTFSDSSQKALNGLQAQIGATNEEMSEYRGIINNIYKKNLGENFQEVANSLVTVRQVAGLSGQALEEMTQNAIMFKDTFSLEVNESVRAATALQKNFGITGNQAYTLIAQGMQKGVNKNGDYLDTLNEYSVQFKSLGFTADQFNDILIQGAENGAFSIDKVGDAIKEFNIRSKDGSKNSMEAFQMLGLNSRNMTKSFASGGQEAQNAFKTVVQQLNKIKDPVKQNQIGVALFGTQFEDLEKQAILSLSNVKNQTDLTADTLEQINKIKYNTFSQSLKGVGRSIQTGLITPISDRLIPHLNNASGKIAQFAPTAISSFQDLQNYIGINVIPRFQGIGDKAQILYQTYFPNLNVSIGDLKNSAGALVTGGLDFVQGSFQWLIDNNGLVKTAITGLTAAWIIHKGIIWGTVAAEKAHMISQTISAGILVAKKAAVAGLTVAHLTGSTALGVITAAQYLWNAAMTANPIGVVVVAVGLLAAGIYALWKNFDKVTGAIKKAFEWLSKWNKTDAKNKNVSTNATVSTSAVLNSPAINAPGLASGGYVKRRPGGIIANIGEGKHDEIVAPVPMLEKVFNSSSSTNVSKSEQPIEIIYSPQIIIQGNADLKVIEEANQKGFEDFKAKFQALTNRDQRLSFDRR